jgi:hypothetical protein
MKGERGLTAWAYAAQISAALASLALLPVLVVLLSVEQLALWMLILTFGQLSALGESSLEPAATRYFSYSWSGLREMPRYGERPPVSGPGNAPADPEMLAATSSTIRWLHRWLAWLSGGVIGLGGAIYLGLLSSGSVWQGEALRAWGLFCAAQVLGSVWSACIPLLQGAGRTIDAIRALTLQRVAFFVVALARHMIAGSVRLWLSRLGGFLVARSSLLLVSSTLGLRTTAAFALTIQLIQGLSAVAQAPLMAAMPRLYVARAQGQMAVLKTDVGKGLILAGMVFGAGALVILIAVAPLLEALGKPEALLPWGPLLVLVVAGALELNHSLFATLLLTNNEVPFVRAALASGLAIVVGVLLVLAYAPAPLMGVALVLLVVQLAYNNWKWPLAAMRSFGTSYAELLRMGLSWPTRPLP